MTTEESISPKHQLRYRSRKRTDVVLVFRQMLWLTAIVVATVTIEKKQSGSSLHGWLGCSQRLAHTIYPSCLYLILFEG